MEHTNHKSYKKLLLYLAKSLGESNPKKEFSLFYSDGGVTLALIHLSDYFEQDAEIVLNRDKYLDGIAEKLVTDERPNLTFSVGCVGFLAAMETCEIPYDLSEIAKHIDRTLIQLLLDFRKKNYPFDPFKGMLGMLNYLRDRKSHIQPTVWQACLREVIDYFDAAKIEIYGGIAWKEDERKDHLLDREMDVLCNLGLAHGSFAIMYWLAYAFHETKYDKGMELLTKANQALTNISKDFGHPHVTYPSVLKKDGSFDGSDLAWCYGDLSAAIVLFNIGELINKDDFKSQARNLALNCANNVLALPPSSDSCLCHGNAGNALMFQLLGEKLNEEKMHEAKRKLVSHLVNHACETNFSGFQNREFNFVTNQMETTTLKNMLNGEAGIALSLLAMKDKKYRSWIKLLLLEY